MYTSQRVNQKPLPQIELIDMVEEMKHIIMKYYQGR